jgi:D-alanyl-D-alanine carboxypeptidase
MAPEDRFRVGSITKSFVATVLLQLVEERKLSLGDSLERWLPGFVPNGRSITVRELLQHTSGLYDYVNDSAFRTAVLASPLLVWTPAQLVRVAVSHRPLFSPGRGWSYSNTNYILAGLVIEAVTHRSVAVELRDRIFRPLDLHQTSFPAGPAISGPHADGYLFYGTPLVRDTAYVSPSAAWAAGAIVSTVSDVATFYSALLDGRLLRPALLAEMESTVRTGDGDGYGLGLLALRTACGRMLGHDGDFPGYATEAFTSPNRQRQLVLFMNSDQSTRRVTKAITQTLNTGLCGHPLSIGQFATVSADRGDGRHHASPPASTGRGWWSRKWKSPARAARPDRGRARSRPPSPCARPGQHSARPSDPSPLPCNRQ